MITYAIDQKLIALFLDKPEESNEVSAFAQNYTAKVTELLKASSLKYMQQNTNWSDEKIKQEMEKFADEDKFVESELMQRDDFILRLTEVKNHYNKLIYDKLKPGLTDEQRQRINAYISQMQEKFDKQYEEDKNMLLNALQDVEDKINRGEL